MVAEVSKGLLSKCLLSLRMAMVRTAEKLRGSGNEGTQASKVQGTQNLKAQNLRLNVAKRHR